MPRILLIAGTLFMILLLASAIAIIDTLTNKTPNTTIGTVQPQTLAKTIPDLTSPALTLPQTTTNTATSSADAEPTGTESTIETSPQPKKNPTIKPNKKHIEPENEVSTKENEDTHQENEDTHQEDREDKEDHSQEGQDD